MLPPVCFLLGVKTVIMQSGSYIAFRRGFILSNDQGSLVCMARAGKSEIMHVCYTCGLFLK